jgi:hypothetical protein
MLRLVGLVRTEVSEELSVSFIRMTRIGALMKEALSFSETSVLTRATRRNIPEDDILQCYPCISTTCKYKDVMKEWRYSSTIFDLGIR